MREKPKAPGEKASNSAWERVREHNNALDTFFGALTNAQVTTFGAAIAQPRMQISRELIWGGA